MVNTASLKSAIHQLIVETYDEKVLSQIREMLYNSKVKESSSEKALKLKLMLLEQEVALSK